MRITHRIWEEKDIGYIYDTYRHNSRVWDDFGLQYGNEKIVADTVHTINAFPDIRLYADEIIWAGDEDEGFHTSHRTVITGHNTGYSKFGAPTGKKVTLWCIANCVSLENEIFAEWVVYDTASLIHQLGFDLREMARTLGNQAAADIDGSRFGESERLRGQDAPPYLPAPDTDAAFDVEELRPPHFSQYLESPQPARSALCLPPEPGLPRLDRARLPGTRRLSKLRAERAGYVPGRGAAN